MLILIKPLVALGGRRSIIYSLLTHKYIKYSKNIRKRMFVVIVFYRMWPCVVLKYEKHIIIYTFFYKQNAYIRLRLAWRFIYLFIHLLLFAHDSLLSSVELLSMRVLPSLAKQLQMSLVGLAVISNFHHRRTQRGIELGILRYTISSQ